MPEKPKIVAVTGCFDVLHYGHVHLIEAASVLGDVYVGIDSDANYQRLKGRKPYHNQQERSRMLGCLKGVRGAAVFNTCLEFLQQLKPDIWVKGSDYSLETLDPDERKFCEDHGISIYFVEHTGHSSSAIKNVTNE